MTDLSHTRAFRAHWTEKRPQPLNLTDSEILDWIGQHCEILSYVKPAAEYKGGFTLDVEGISTTKSETLREAVKLAAAKLKAANE